MQKLQIFFKYSIYTLFFKIKKNYNKITSILKEGKTLLKNSLI